MNISDPKMDDAITEIEAILSKHDLVGAFYIQSEEETSSVLILSASWNAFTDPEKGKTAVRESITSEQETSTMEMLMDFDFADLKQRIYFAAKLFAKRSKLMQQRVK